MYTVYEVYREGELLPDGKWVKVRGELDFRTGGTKRSPHKVANVFGPDFKPLLGDMEHAVVRERPNGHIGIEGEQKATHEKGMYWDKTSYKQYWLCVPVVDRAGSAI